MFGARGTGKTTLLKSLYNLEPLALEQKNETYLVDLLDPDQEEQYSRNPNLLSERVTANSQNIKRVILDEVQKVPKLLDVVHSLIEQFKDIQFILTGSSARKLKHGGANLLGGRAFTFYLHPFTFLEAPNKDNIVEILSWGTLPKIFEYDQKNDKARFLKTYTQTYLKQEI